jgi:HSP20 family protein
MEEQRPTGEHQQQDFQQIEPQKGALQQQKQQQLQRPQRVYERTIPCDVFENEVCYLILADIPGVSRDNLHVDVQGNNLILRAERMLGDEQTLFERRFLLPDSADVDQINASLNNGVVRVEIQKTQKSRPRRIEIKG